MQPTPGELDGTCARSSLQPFRDQLTAGIAHILSHCCVCGSLSLERVKLCLLDINGDGSATEKRKLILLLDIQAGGNLGMQDD